MAVQPRIGPVTLNIPLAPTIGYKGRHPVLGITLEAVVIPPDTGPGTADYMLMLCLTSEQAPVPPPPPDPDPDPGPGTATYMLMLCLTSEIPVVTPDPTPTPTPTPTFEIMETRTFYDKRNNPRRVKTRFSAFKRR